MERGFDREWQGLAAGVLSGVKEWRLAHPQATLVEIEQAVDEGLSALRVRLLTDTALASAATDLRKVEREARPVCPACGTRMEARGKAVRELTSQGNQTVKLARSYAVCPHCQAVFFPSG